MDRRSLPLAAVGGHFALTGLHGLVHAAVPVSLPGLPAALAALVLFVLPLLGAGLTAGGFRRPGASLLLGAGLAGVALEGTLHFLLANPDHVAHVGAHRTAFGLTAALTTGGDLLLVGAGWQALRSDRDPGAA